MEINIFVQYLACGEDIFKLHLCSYFATLMLIICVYMHAKSLQSCLTLCNPMNWSPSGSSVHGILQARIQSGLPFPSPGDLPNPGIKPVSLLFAVLAGRFFTTSATWEALKALCTCVQTTSARNITTPHLTNSSSPLKA